MLTNMGGSVACSLRELAKPEYLKAYASAADPFPEIYLIPGLVHTQSKVASVWIIAPLCDTVGLSWTWVIVLENNVRNSEK